MAVSKVWIETTFTNTFPFHVAFSSYCTHKWRFFYLDCVGLTAPVYVDGLPIFCFRGRWEYSLDWIVVRHVAHYGLDHKVVYLTTKFTARRNVKDKTPGSVCWSKRNNRWLL